MTGSCPCGGVRFEVTEDFLAVTACHCTNCKKISGGGGTVSGRARTPAVRVLAGEDPPFEREPETHIYVRSVAPWETLPDDGAERWDPPD